MSVCLCVCVSVCLCLVCLFVCLSVWLCVHSPPPSLLSRQSHTRTPSLAVAWGCLVQIDYVAEVTELETYGEVGWPHFRLAMRLLLAREWFDALAAQPEWVRVDSEQFGSVFYHRETGEPRFDEPDAYQMLHSDP